MLSDEEKGIRRFVRGQLRGEADLSTLTLVILKKRYLAQSGCDSISSEARKFMKQVVGEELAKMQENDDSESEVEAKIPQKKRKREKEQKDLESEDEAESTAKKLRSQQSGSSSDSADEQNYETGSQIKEQIRFQTENEEEEAAEVESDHENSKKSKHCATSDDSSDEEINESEKGGNESSSSEDMVKKKASSKNGYKRRIDPSGGKKTPRSDESESDSDKKSEKSDNINDGDFAGSEKEENAKKRKDSDSDSSSLSSLEDEKKSSPKKTKAEKQKKKTKKTKESRGPKDEDKAVIRLKRYIALCGVRRNYKKLLDGCRSTRSKVAVLKKELEDLGVHGNPSIEKCKKIRLKREEAQELAELNVENIITTEGRPKRRGTSAMPLHKNPPSSYQRTLNSDSDSDRENNAHKGRRKISEWANLHGIISDDAESD